MNFTHLHLHLETSLADATLKPKSLAARVKELGMNAVAATDHGVMFGLPTFYQACKAEGIKPILGLETYVAPRLNTQKEASLDNANYHLVLLCENNVGWNNLIKLESDAAINGFYYRARTDKQKLKMYSEGLIALSACIGGEVQKLILDNKYEEAKATAFEYNDIFGQGNFYLELQDHGMVEQAKVNAALIRMSNETKIPLVCTNDCHYLHREGYNAHDVLMAIQAKTTVDDTKRKKYASDEFYVKSPAEMYSLFAYIPEAMENTVKIANRCNVELEFGVNKIPPFDIPDSFNGTNLDYLKMLVMKGCSKLYGELTSEHIDRIDYELKVVDDMGYINYFLIVWDFFRFCEFGTDNIEDEPDEDWIPILTGPGRGSGAGSILLYGLGVTNIDPIKYNLLFERFLDPSRISMPDVDSDFAYERRQEVVDYVIRKYGRECVAQIITFGTMAARQSIRKVGAATNTSYAMIDTLAKMVPQEPGITIKKALSMVPDLNHKYSTNDEVKKLLDMAMELEGTPIYTSTHAAGVLITDKRGVTEHVPVWNNDGAIVTQFPMGTLDDLGLLKMDFLGLRTLSVIDQTIIDVEKNHGVKLSLDEIYKCKDLKPLKLIQDGFTIGIFQLEGAGMTGFMKELKPQNVEEIIAGISLYRPGPMKFIPKFLENRRNPDNIQYRFPELKSVLSETYGMLVYQEQCMRTVIAVAGYNKSDSDSFRKVISKKKKKELPLHRKWFTEGREELDLDSDGHMIKYNPISGGIKLHGHDKKDLDEMFDEMEDFASYCFNKSHAAAYAVVGYATAYLLYYYPTEFMAALMTSVKGNQKRIAIYIKACQDLGIEILPPDINAGNDKFVPLPGKKIVYTLSAKFANDDVLNGVVAIREKEPIKDLRDFFVRGAYTLNKQTIEALVSIGALDSLGVVRSQVLAGLDDVWEYMLKQKTKDRSNEKAWEKYSQYKKDLYASGCEDECTRFKGKDRCPDCKTRRPKKVNKPKDFEIDVNLEDFFPNIQEFPNDVILKLEKKYMGIYMSGHPLHKYSYAISNISNIKTTDLYYDVDEETGAIVMQNPVFDGQKIKIIAMMNSIKTTVTKAKKEPMAFAEIEDLEGSCRLLIFPRQYTECKDYLQEDVAYYILGSVQIKDDEPPIIICEGLRPADEKIIDRVIVNVKSAEEGIHMVRYIQSNAFIQGTTPIYIQYGNSRILLKREFWVNSDVATKEFENSFIQKW